MPSSSRARWAAATCGGPPSTTTRPGRVGELARPPGVRVDEHRAGASRHPAAAREPGLLVEQPPEPPGDHLVHRRDVVLAVDALDDEPAVLALAGQPVLEDHHRRDDLGALQVGHVVALDPQRHLVQPERLAGSPRAPGCGWSGRWPAWSCAAPATARRCGRPSPGAPSCRRAAAPGSAPCSPAGRRAAARTSPRRAAAPAPGSPAGSSRPRPRRRAGAGSPRPARRCRPPRRGRRPSRAGPGPGRRGRRRSAPRPRAGPRPGRPRRRRRRRRAPPACFSSARLIAPRSSRSRAARSKSSASEAAYISFSMRRMNGRVCPAMKSQKSSTISRCSSAVTLPTQGATHLPM